MKNKLKYCIISVFMMLSSFIYANPIDTLRENYNNVFLLKNMSNIVGEMSVIEDTILVTTNGFRVADFNQIQALFDTDEKIIELYRHVNDEDIGVSALAYLFLIFEAEPENIYFSFFSKIYSELENSDGIDIVTGTEEVLNFMNNEDVVLLKEALVVQIRNVMIEKGYNIE